ncbi:mechanosensitive ion channel family protein [Agromyces endophyticus]|uniref:mechanosensitive ion channel family protein n=1 Tax=Agromyces sp. H17E-10 TaxID=2932244 RepID=UPI001FD2CBAA|nr:mechanosensitive ion channel domain-containing protein [Agromyces sp. H17E-10]UOQ87627.1 mechanosensitive ion channel family protein [Agromyces sp. H17E-10]
MDDWWKTLEINGWSIAAVVVTLLATWILAHFARKGVRAGLARVPTLTPAVGVLAESIVVYGIWLGGIGIALTFIGASVQPLLAVVLIVLVVLVLVLRGIADNFAAGVVLQTRRPLAVGDEIESGDYTGTVHEINGRSVIIRTADGRTVHVPNAQILSDPLVNHSEHGSRRSEIEVRTGGQRVDAAGETSFREAIVDAAAGAQGVHRKQGVHVRPITLGSGRAVYRVQFWHHPLHGVAVTADVVDAVAAKLAVLDVDAVVTSAPPPSPLAMATEL